MKKGFFTFVLALLGSFSFSQSLHKGNLLGLHTYTPNLKPGITIQDYTKFYTSRVIPEFEKAFPDIKLYLLKSVRGQDSSSIAVVYFFNSEAVRNKYFKNDGTPTEVFNAANAKLSDLGKETDKYETSSNTPDKYNDWLVE
ncbi:MAG TPA: hypothetical protein VKI61_14290 [Chitinophagaceae bacterium]|jgi:hypothetical protein|nr:hypothetical protein [Chitinophagaceae bacterium]